MGTWPKQATSKGWPLCSTPTGGHLQKAGGWQIQSTDLRDKRKEGKSIHRGNSGYFQYGLMWRYENEDYQDNDVQ